MRERILIIDDDPDTLDLLTDVLGEEGYTVQTSLSSTFMLEHVQRDQPDLILLDIRLGEKDGQVLCRQLKANALTEHIHVILVSAYLSTNKALGAPGADDFLAKPFNLDQLLQLVRKHLPQPERL